METKNSNKPVRITNTKAIELIRQRAAIEERSAANAAAVTIIEALGPKTPSNDNDPTVHSKASTQIMRDIKEKGILPVPTK